MKNDGYTVTYIRWDDCLEWVAGRFKTKEELDEFLDKIHKPSSGWIDDELMTISIHNDFNYHLPY